LKKLIRRTAFFAAGILLSLTSFCQEQRPGVIAGNLVDDKSKAVASATVELLAYSDSIAPLSMTTDKDGIFSFTNLPFAFYKLKISYMAISSWCWTASMCGPSASISTSAILR
jgi:hypothetical protein